MRVLRGDLRLRGCDGYCRLMAFSVFVVGGGSYVDSLLLPLFMICGEWENGYVIERLSL